MQQRSNVLCNPRLVGTSDWENICADTQGSARQAVTMMEERGKELCSWRIPQQQNQVATSANDTQSTHILRKGLQNGHMRVDQKNVLATTTSDSV